MTSTTGEQPTSHKAHLKPIIAEANVQENVSSADAQLEKASQLLAHPSFFSHHPKSGVNPLVDFAAYLFSIIGKLKQLKSYRHLNKYT